jgi:hypothetical protein
MRKKRGGRYFLAFLVVLAALFIIPATRQEIRWLGARIQNTSPGYGHFLQKFPNSRHTAAATEKWDDLDWKDVPAANSVESFKGYLELHPKGRHAQEARDGIEQIFWDGAGQTNTILAYRAFLEGQPDGKHAAEAKAREVALRINPAPYEAAVKSGSEETLKTFLSDYPGHEKESAVQAVLKDLVEGIDIFDLLREKKIEVKVQGSGIESINVSLRKRIPEPITARIPVGTYFASANSGAQNMVTTSEERVRLNSDEWMDVSPAAACANRPLDIPDEEVSFSVRRLPQQGELAKLMPVLEKAGVDSETRQAAVWIITDDADYDDLGTLVASQFGFGGSRVINELETARAMKICEEAGINIRYKRIWGDRAMILEGLQDEELKKWLQGKK